MTAGRAPLPFVTVVAAAFSLPVVILPVASGSVTAPAVCSSSIAPPPQVAELPWPQRRNPPEQVNKLTTGAGVTVAVIDSGVDDDHPQLRGRVAPGADFLDTGDGRTDCVGHGTAVAGLIAARPLPGVGFAGLAPDARILPVRVSEQQVVEGRESGRTVTAPGFAEAIRWAVDHDADVLNLSVVIYQDHPAVRSAVAHALSNDVVVVAAAGNLHTDGARPDPIPYPASYTGVIGVGAIGPDGARGSFSQVGPYVDVVAPGAEVLSAAPGGGHRSQSGTSYAVPFVAATAALVRAYQPTLSAPEVAARILATTDPTPATGRDSGYGSGAVNPYRAVTETPHTAPAAPTPSTEAPAPTTPTAAAVGATPAAAARHRAIWLAAATVGAAVLILLVAASLPRRTRHPRHPA